MNHFSVFGLQHFDHIVSEYVTYYDECRPHQGIGNRLIGKEEDHGDAPPSSLNEIQCQTRLGGLLKHYYRAA